MTTIWHNPRCSKSRQTLQLLKDRGIEPTIIAYLDAPPTVKDLETLLKKLGMTPDEIMRTGEQPYKDDKDRLAGMTAAERHKTTQILRDAARTRAVVVIEHDMEFVRRLGCKVTVLHEGSVLAEGSIDHVAKNKDVIEVYLGR